MPPPGMTARVIMATASITGEVLGTPNETRARNLTGDQPKLFTLGWRWRIGALA